MRVQFLGGARTVTGSAVLLESGPLAWLVDCGMFQGGKAIERRNWNLRPYHATEIQFILLTHAHIDHSGLIPKIVKEGFRGKIISTRATFDLCGVMLPDSGHIHEMEAEWQNRRKRRSGKEGLDPLYTVKDSEESLRYFQPVPYDQVLPLSDRVKVRFRDAGHILGSAILEIWVEEGGTEKKLVFSGDLGNSDLPIVRDPSPIEEGDVVFIESTYGDRQHRTREETVQELLAILQDAIRHGSKVIIPAFAVERTQDIVYTIGQLIRTGSIPSIPVYIDSPLAISATEIFKKNSDCFDEETRAILLGGQSPLEYSEIVYARTTEDSKAIDEDKGPGVVISASGMCESGRIKHHLKHHLWRPESHVVIIGYQGEGTLGRRIVDGAKKVKILGEEIAVKARVHTLGGFSAHADQKGLLQWLSHFRSSNLRVFVNHGEEKASMELGRLIRERFQVETSIPQWMERTTLFAAEPPRVSVLLPSEKEPPKAPRPTQTLLGLVRDLDRSYKRLRRRLRKEKLLKMDVQYFRWLKGLEELRTKIEELNSDNHFEPPAAEK